MVARKVAGRNGVEPNDPRGIGARVDLTRSAFAPHYLDIPSRVRKGDTTVAQRTIVQLTDDLDGKPIADGQGETVRFALDRQDYEIDLGEKNAKAMRDAMNKYVAAARRVSGSTRGGRSRGGTRSAAAATREYDPKAVRAWAESQGIEVSQRGRVPAELVAKFQEANA
jgi:hypothetical protein